MRWVSKMEINAQIRGQEAVADLLATLSGPKAAAAYAKAMNDTAFQVRREMQAEFGRVFDRVTPYILKSSYVQMATPEQLYVRIAPENQRDKAGVDPQKILQAQTFGGTRNDKRSEVLLRNANILPNGYMTAIPAEKYGGPYPGSDDGNGNLRGAFLQQLISYFGAFTEQGSRSNMTAKRKKNIHKGTKKQDGRRYFVAYGPLRDGRASHLPPGIWAASGTGDCIVKPVLMFIRRAFYKPRLSMDRIAKNVDVQEYLDKRVRFRIREVAGV